MKTTESRIAAVSLDRVAFVPVPDSAEAPADSVITFPGLPLVERLLKEFSPSFVDLARRVRRIGPVDGGAVVMLAGCHAGVGCSSLALAFAAAAASRLSSNAGLQAGSTQARYPWPPVTAAGERKVVLVDADLSQPGLSNMLGQPLGSNPWGWTDAVCGRCPIDQPLCHADARKRLPFLPLKHPVAQAEQLLISPGLGVWLGQLRRHYSLVVLDAGPISESGRRWAPLADVAMLVCNSKEDNASERALAWDQLEEGGSHVLGIVENTLP